MKVAVVILNWNGKKLLETFLPSVVDFSGTAEIYIADNASTDDSLSFIKKNYPKIQIILNSENKGFAGGYNAALKQIETDYYVLLNSDVEVTNGWIDSVMNVLQNDHSIVAAQPKILWHQNKKLFEYSGAAGGYIDEYGYPFCKGRLFDTLEEDNGQYDNSSEIFWACGAALFIRAEVYHAVGGLDEMFFAHMEEIDLCWRLKNLGYKIMYVPSSTVYHVGGATLDAYNPKKTYLNFRNNLYMIVKNDFYSKNLFFKVLTRMLMDGISGLKYISEGKLKHCLAIIKAHFSFYSNLKFILKKRANLRELIKADFKPTCIYQDWIVWAYFFSKKKKYSDLENKLFSEN